MTRLALIDVDGTLVDSNDGHARAWVEAAEEAGFQLSFERVRPLIGMGGDQLIPRALGLQPGDPRAAGIASRQTDLFLERYLDAVRAFAGARELLARMRDEGLRVFVASSSGPEKLGPLLERAGVRDLVEGSVPPDDVDRSKPARDLVAAALEKTGVAAGDAVMIGDTPYDVEACRRAGVRIVAVRCGGWRDEDLEGAEAVYDDPADVLAHFEETPFAR